MVKQYHEQAKNLFPERKKIKKIVKDKEKTCKANRAPQSPKRDQKGIRL
jgi:hypothetical protein